MLSCHPAVSLARLIEQATRSNAVLLACANEIHLAMGKHVALALRRPCVVDLDTVHLSLPLLTSRNRELNQ